MARRHGRITYRWGVNFTLLKCVSRVCERLFGVLTTPWCARRTAPQVFFTPRPHGSAKIFLLQPSSAPSAEIRLQRKNGVCSVLTLYRLYARKCETLTAGLLKCETAKLIEYMNPAAASLSGDYLFLSSTAGCTACRERVPAWESWLLGVQGRASS